MVSEFVNFCARKNALNWLVIEMLRKENYYVKLGWFCKRLWAKRPKPFDLQDVKIMGHWFSLKHVGFKTSNYVVNWKKKKKRKLKRRDCTDLPEGTSNFDIWCASQAS